jgi:polyisoprenoid-binding protein YceI
VIRGGALGFHDSGAAVALLLQEAGGQEARASRGAKGDTMAKWVLEPGHTSAEFCARHMMVTYVRGHFKNVRGTLSFDETDPASAIVEAIIDAKGLWTGEPDRDAHLRSADFLDVERHPEIRFRGGVVQRLGALDFKVKGELTIRGVTRPAVLDVHYLGRWSTPWWEGGVDKGPKIRAGFVAETTINRHDFGVSWNSPLELGGVVVGDEVRITIDAEAILEER